MEFPIFPDDICYGSSNILLVVCPNVSPKNSGYTSVIFSPCRGQLISSDQPNGTCQVTYHDVYLSIQRCPWSIKPSLT